MSSNEDAELEVLVNHDEKKADENVKTITMTRNVYTQEAFNDMYKVEKPPQPLCDTIKRNIDCSGSSVGKMFLSYLPVVKFIRTYKLKEYILGDFLSGLTVSFMHLPQAMGFGILASLRPINGLYSTFFPVLVYLLFGTSPYISFGTNAVMALLTQTVVEREAEAFISTFSGPNGTEPTDDQIMDVKIGASMACCVIAGAILMGMGFLRLGVLTSYLSVSFVGGFTTAAAFHIASSQVPKMFGIKVKSFAGAGKLVLMYVDLFRKIAQTKPAEIIIAIISIAALLLVKICINEKYQSKMKMPIPIDLIVVVIGTIISHFAKFKEIFDVTIVGQIPSGFQSPSLPDFSNAGNFASDAFVMAILSLAMSISMAKFCANKHGVPLNDNQELIAYGASNFVSGFFYSFPSATAPPRTMILSSLGARTTLNAIATSVFFLLVILVIGQLFVSLPLSVLAAMIIVSMKDILLQYRTLPTIWKINKYDFCIWVLTNSVGILVDLNYGIIAGVGVSILLTVIHDQFSAGHLVGVSNKEDLVLMYPNDRNAKEVAGVKIFKISTNLYFATAERIKNQIYTNVLHPRQYLKKLKKLENLAKAEVKIGNGEVDEEGKLKDTNVPFEKSEEDEVKAVVLDLSMVQYIDMAGIAALQQVVKDFKEVKVDVFLVSVADKVYATLDIADVFKYLPKDHVYINVFDALSEFENGVNCSCKI